MANKRIGKKRGIRNFICSICDKKVENLNKRYCNECHAEYMSKWRKNHPPSEIQKFKNNVRRKTNMRIKRGLLIPLPCEMCGKIKVEAHHEDYNKPYEIKWLCFKHHREHHKNLIM